MGEKERSLLYELSKVRPGGRGDIDGAVSGVDQALVTGETPRASVWGKFPSGRLGLLVATDSRLIAFDKGLLTRTVNVHETPYDMIKAINHKFGWFSGEITILTFPSGGLSIQTVQGKGYKEVILAFAGWVRNRIGAKGGESEMWRGERTTTASLSADRSHSLADELAKLAALRDTNVLSETEFFEAKKRLLNI